MSVFVVDASVVVKFFLPEIHSEAAQRLLENSHDYVAPDLLFPEAANAIWKKVRRGQLTIDQGQSVIADVTAIAVATVATRELVAEAYALAASIRQTVYDCVYLALAIRLDTQCITADERFAAAVKEHPMLAKHVCAVQTFGG